MMMHFDTDVGSEKMPTFVWRSTHAHTLRSTFTTLLGKFVTHIIRRYNRMRFVRLCVVRAVVDGVGVEKFAKNDAERRDTICG